MIPAMSSPAFHRALTSSVSFLVAMLDIDSRALLSKVKALQEKGALPVLWIRTTDHNLDQHLIRARVWDGRVDNLHDGAWGNYGFLHD